MTARLAGLSSVIPVLVTGIQSRDVRRVGGVFGAADAAPPDPRHKAEDDGECGD